MNPSYAGSPLLLGFVLLASCNRAPPPPPGPITKTVEAEAWTERSCLSNARETARLACESIGLSDTCRAPRLVDTTFGNCKREYPTSTYVFAFGADNPEARLSVDWVGCQNHYCVMVNGIGLVAPGNRVLSSKMKTRSIAVSLAHALWAPQMNPPWGKAGKAKLHARKCPKHDDEAPDSGGDTVQVCVFQKKKHDRGYARVTLRKAGKGWVGENVYWDEPW